MALACLPAIESGVAPILVGSIAALVGAASWLGRSAVAGFLWYFGKRSREIERMIALQAEIKTNLPFQASIANDEFVRNVHHRLDKDQSYRFFVPVYREDIVFDTIKKDITDLPAGPIDDVVDYYNQSNGLDVILTRLEEPRFESFDVERRKSIVTALSNAAEGVIKSGNKAISTLEAQIVRSLFQKYLLLGLAGFVVLLGLVAAYRIYAAIKVACFT